MTIEDTRKHIKYLQQFKRDLKYSYKTNLRKKDKIKEVTK